MAIVQYDVMYRYVHPTTKKPVTNTTIEKYDFNERFIKAYPNSDGINSAEVLAEQDASNEKYDMVFVYDGVQEINSIIGGTVPLSSHVLVEKFQRCIGQCWFIASTHTSLASALNAADPMIRTLGKSNVKVIKNVPMDISVGLE